MKIVTAGYSYLDIDAYAGCVAYAELLRLQGEDARAVSTAAWNESVTQSVRAWQAPLETTYRPHADDRFALVDISEPRYFEKFVDLARIDEVIDHHSGMGEYWRQRIGKGADIEFIGAACTQIYERWQAVNLLDKISVTSARLLATGILDNTLNLKARVTTDRDRAAYADLMRRADLPDDWPAQYFAEVQAAILQDVPTAIQNDTKVMRLPGLENEVAFGQMAVWDARAVIAHHQTAIARVLSSMQPDWFMNVISINEGKSYILTPDKSIQTWLQKLLDAQFDGPVAHANRLWLRKEVMKRAMDLARES